MAQDLEVDTTLIRQAADILDDAARTFGGTSGERELTCPLTDASLGPTPLGREVVAGASKRVRQAAEAADRLGLLSSDTAAKLRISANAFEQAESSAIAGPR